MVCVSTSSAPKDHDALRQQMSDFATLMGRPYAESRAAMLTARVEFARTFAAHVAADRVHLQSLRLMQPAAMAPIIDRYEQRMADLQKLYSAHINTWTPARIAADWNEYGRSVKSLQARLRTQMTWEEEHIPAAT